MAGLTAVDEARAAKIVELCSSWIHIDLADVNVQALHALAQGK
jgi:hypothetical protein